MTKIMTNPTKIQNKGGEFIPVDKLLGLEIDHKEYQPVNTNVLRVGTSFSGIGCPEQGLKEMGINYSNEFMIEINKFSRQTYLENHSVNNVFEDVTKVDPKELPDIDLFVFGSPCQSFSINGKRRGLEDTRGTLVFNGLQIIKEKQPKYFIFENVKGMTNHDGGQTFKIILESFEELGYNFDSKVLNTKDFGLPQNRERLFVIGTRKDLNEKFTFPKPTPLTKTVNDFIKKDKNLVYKTFDHQDKVRNYPKEGNINVIYKLPNVKFNQDGRISSTNGISPCLTCGSNHKFYDTKNKVFRHLNIEELSQIQGFRNFKFPVSDSQSRKQLGNSMSVNVIKSLFENLLTEYLPQNQEVFKEEERLVS